jgi:membrane fusion protein (multidrug efflux system)
MKSQISILLLTLTLFAVACSPISELEKKRTELAKLEAQSTELDNKIKKLEDEIEILDTTVEETLIPVKAQKLNAGMFSNTLGIQGLVTSDNNVHMSAELGGTVKDILVKEGQSVRKGQLLVKLDGSSVASQIAELRNALELATTAYERQKRLWDQNIGSEMQYLQAKNNKDDLENKIATVNSQLAKYSITAPISGIVDKIYINEGEVASPGSPVVQVVNNKKINVEADIAESHVGKFKVGDAVTIHYPALGISAEEKIASIGQVIDPDNRTFTIVISPKNNLKQLKPNLLAMIDVSDYKTESSIVVPTKLIRREGEKRYIYTVNTENKKTLAKKTYVVIEKSFSTNTVIQSGLDSGDLIIVEGYNAVIEGDELKVIK